MRLEAAITIRSPRSSKPSISTSSWLSVWSFSRERSKPRLQADRVELVDEDDRRRVLLRDREQAADARRAEAGEHLDERARGLAEEVCAGLAARRPWRAASCRCRAGRAAGCPWAPCAPSFLKRSGSRRNSTTSRSSCLASSQPATSSQPIAPEDLRLDLLRLGARHHLEACARSGRPAPPSAGSGSQVDAQVSTLSMREIPAASGSILAPIGPAPGGVRSHRSKPGTRRWVLGPKSM